MMSPTPSPEAPTPTGDDPVDWTHRFGGAVIDAQGNEIPITPDMVQAACEALERQSITGLHARAPTR